MILPFSTLLNGKPTHFVPRILLGLEAFKLMERVAVMKQLDEYFTKFPAHYKDYAGTEVSPKLHTIRVDAKDRWHPFLMIHFFINNRTPDMFRFAPIVPCTATQKIMIISNGPNDFDVFVDDIALSASEQERFIVNDGFDSREEFEAHFLPPSTSSFTGKLIHWTELRY